MNINELEIQKIKIILEEYEDLLERNNFQEFYDSLNGGDYTLKLISRITYIFTSSGIDPLKHMSKVPSYYMRENMELKEINIPANINAIGTRAFMKCFNLKKVVLHEGLKTIGIEAFSGCDLREIYIPNSVDVIRPFAFAYNPHLTKVSIGNNPNIDISSTIVKYCPNLTEITFRGKMSDFLKDPVLVVTYSSVCDFSAVESILCDDGELVHDPKSEDLFKVR